MIEVSKSQGIRLVDVLFIGPLMIYAGSQRKLSPTLSNALIVIGIATIAYNGRNYLINRGMK
jgi:hypothetical protein